MEKLQNALHFFREAEGLKRLLRHSYLSDGRQEDVAEHSWRMALMALVLHKEYEEPVNLERVLKMILVHDLPEVYAGDFPATKERPDNKHELEREALEKLTANLEAKMKEELMGLWLEFESEATPEAKFAMALDKLEALLQHNEADISTWDEEEFPFSLTGFDEKMEHSSFLMQFRKILRMQSEKKMAEAKQPH